MELYKKYPQLLSDDTDPCVRGLNQLLINMATSMPHEIMVESSVHQLNDLGSQRACEEGSAGDLATYATLKLNITYIPVELISGLCLPKECS